MNGVQMSFSQAITGLANILNAEAAGVVLYDPETNQLAMQEPAVGLTHDEVIELRFSINGPGLAPKVFRTGQPYLADDVTKDPDLLPKHAASSRNTIIVPLDGIDRRIGVIGVWNKRLGTFDQHELNMMRAIASWLAAQIEKAVQLEHDRHAVDQLRKECLRHQDALEHALSVQQELMRAATALESLEVLCDRLGKFLNTCVFVLDRSYQVIGVSAEDHSLPFDRFEAAIKVDGAAALAPAGQTNGWRIPDYTGANRSVFVAPVIAGAETLAYVVVSEANRLLDDGELRLVEYAAAAVALRILSAGAGRQHRLMSDDLFGGLLGTADLPEEKLARHAAELNLDLAAYRTMLVVGIDGEQDDGRNAEDGLLREKVLSIIQRVARGAIVSVRGDGIAVLAESRAKPAQDDLRTLRALGDAIRAEVKRSISGISVSVGVGNLGRGRRGYLASFKQALRALETLRASGQTDRTQLFAEMEILDLLVDRQTRGALTSLVGREIGRLLTYDLQHDTSFTETLRAYLVHDGHLHGTAKALGVHLSTLRYRLERIEQLTGANLRDASSKFQLQLALKVFDLLRLPKEGFSHLCAEEAPSSGPVLRQAVS